MSVTPWRDTCLACSDVHSSPGSSKDDEVLYGNPEDRSSATGAGTSSNTDGLAGQGSHFGSGTTSSGAPQLQSQPAAEKDDGMLRQVL